MRPSGANELDRWSETVLLQLPRRCIGPSIEFRISPLALCEVSPYRFEQQLQTGVFCGKSLVLSYYRNHIDTAYARPKDRLQSPSVDGFHFRRLPAKLVSSNLVTTRPNKAHSHL